MVGDLCGHFVTEDRIDGFPSHSAIAQVSKRILGPVPSDLRACTRRARRKLLFSVEPNFREGLDQCILSESMRQQFRTNGFELSEEVIVSIEKKYRLAHRC